MDAHGRLEFMREDWTLAKCNQWRPVKTSVRDLIVGIP